MFSIISGDRPRALAPMLLFTPFLILRRPSADEIRKGKKKVKKNVGCFSTSFIGFTNST
jgi:hypothetical protein